FSSRRRHTRFSRDWSSDVCSSDLRRDRTNKREGDVAGLVNAVGVGQPVLFKHRDTHAIPGAEPIWLVQDLVKGRRNRTIAGATGGEGGGKKDAGKQGGSSFHQAHTFGSLHPQVEVRHPLLVR